MDIPEWSEVEEFANATGVNLAQCAKWLMEHKLRGGLDAKGEPISNWRAALSVWITHHPYPEPVPEWRIPGQIIEAARTVELWFKEQNIDRWILGGIASRTIRYGDGDVFWPTTPPPQPYCQDPAVINEKKIGQDAKIPLDSTHPPKPTSP